MANINSKQKNKIKFNLKSYLGELLTFVSIVSGILITIYNSSEIAQIAYIFALAAQVSGCVAGIFITITKYQYQRLANENKLLLDEKDKTISSLLDEKVRNIKEKINTKNQIHEQMIVIGSSVKNNAIHSNAILVEIPERGNKQYQNIQNLLHTDYNEYILAQKCLESIREFGNEIYKMFNTYCRNTTDSAVKLLQSYFIINGLFPRFSIAIELLDTPYNPSNGGFEDLKVYTAFRDNETYKMSKDFLSRDLYREIGKNKYTVSLNSDFSHCLTNDNYIINNVTSDDKSVKYESTRGFLKFYNSSMVVPIKIKSTNGGSIIFGYMCCDCMNNDSSIKIFDLPSAFFLYAYAQNLGTFLETLDSNWIDRTRDLPVNSKNILELLDKKIYKGN